MYYKNKLKIGLFLIVVLKTGLFAITQLMFDGSPNTIWHNIKTGDLPTNETAGTNGL